MFSPLGENMSGTNLKAKLSLYSKHVTKFKLNAQTNFQQFKHSKYNQGLQNIQRSLSVADAKVRRCS